MNIQFSEFYNELDVDVVVSGVGAERWMCFELDKTKFSILLDTTPVSSMRLDGG